MSSKKKRRKKEYLKRKRKRDENRIRLLIRNAAFESGDIETAAQAMGIKLN